MIFGLENRGETSYFISCHFDETMAILILRFLCFGARKRITGDCFVIRINKMTFKTKCGMFYLFQYFLSTFPTTCFPHSFVQGDVQMAYMDAIIYHQVNGSSNETMINFN